MMMMMDVAGAMKKCIINVAGIVNIRLSSFQITDYNADGRFIYVSVVRYYTTITFDTSWSLMSSLLKAHIIIILYGDGGETESIELKRYHYLHASIRHQRDQTFALQTQCKVQEYLILRLLTDLYLFIYFIIYLLNSPRRLNTVTGDEIGLASQLISAHSLTTQPMKGCTTPPGSTLYE